MCHRPLICVYWLERLLHHIMGIFFIEVGGESTIFSSITLLGGVTVAHSQNWRWLVKHSLQVSKSFQTNLFCANVTKFPWFSWSSANFCNILNTASTKIHFARARKWKAEICIIFVFSYYYCHEWCVFLIHTKKWSTAPFSSNFGPLSTIFVCAN